MNDRGGGRQYSRGGPSLGGPRRIRRRIRNFYSSRNNQGSGYRDHRSFSEDRNDSSPPSGPPNQNLANHSRQGPPSHLIENEPYQQRMQPRGSHNRGPQRHHNNNLNNNLHDHNHQNDSDYPQDNYHQRHHQQSNYDKLASGYDYDNNSHLASNDQPQQQSHSSSRGHDPSRKFDELTKSFHNQKSELDEVRILLSKLTTELDQVKSRVVELESSNPKVAQGSQTVSIKEGGDNAGEKEKRKKSKLKKRDRRRANSTDKQQAPNLTQQDIQPEQKTGNQPTSAAPMRTERRLLRNKRTRRREKDFPKPPGPNDDSTTQAAEPSSEDRPEGDDDRELNSQGRRIRMTRRQRFGNRRGDRFKRRNRRRMDSSERNSNDTSPQNEANGTDENHRDKRRGGSRKKVFPELSEEKMNEVVQALQREFEASDKSLDEVKSVINIRGPRVAYEFAFTILEYAICNVTSQATLAKTAMKLQKLICSEDNTSEVDFQQAFYEALTNISSREDEIAIDAPRYIEDLGQLLAECIIEMLKKHKYLVKRFLNKSIQAYGEKNRALLLASIMRSLQNSKSDRFAKEIWDIAHLSWDNLSIENDNLADFLKSQNVEFTTKTFPPEVRKSKKGPEDLEKFADHVTNLVESQSPPQALEELMKDLNEDEVVEYRGTLIYAIIRGCLNQESENYKLDNDALNKYSSILRHENEKQDDIALHALTALTRLWHHYNCPQDLMRLMLMTLYNFKTASYGALNNWLTLGSLTHVPGMAAARLSSRRFIEDVGATIKT